MKYFYSCLDPFVSAPQTEQHSVIKKLTDKNNGKIIFYGSEDFFVADSQPFILLKLKRTQNIDAVVFFSINQFCYGDTFNVKLIKEILKLKISVHFAREDISIENEVELDEMYIELIGYYQSTCNLQNIF